ncbi:hypothetical protein ANTRET_LOCUS6371 [Anthophora retusa]
MQMQAKFNRARDFREKTKVALLLRRPRPSLGCCTLLVAYSFLQRTIAEGGGGCGGGKSGADDLALASRYQSSEGASRRSTSGQKTPRASPRFRNHFCRASLTRVERQFTREV